MTYDCTVMSQCFLLHYRRGFDMKIKILLAAAMLFGATSVSALTLFPGSGLQSGTQFEDDNVDFHVDAAGNVVSREFQVGDRLISALEFGQLTDILAPNDPNITLNTAADELVGFADLTITAINAATGRVDFAATNGNTAVSLYNLGSEIDFQRETCASLTACLDAITDGELWVTLGFADADDEWFSVASPIANNSANVAQIGAGTNIALVNFALSVLVNNSGIEFLNQELECNPFLFACAGDGITQIVGTATLQGGSGLTSGAFARSDTDVITNNVPEPTSIALIGVGLLAFGFRRNFKNA